MAVRQILLDTNAYAAFKRNVSDAVEIIQHVPLISINSIVLGELLSGFALGNRDTVNRQQLKQFMGSERVTLHLINYATSEYYATIYRSLKSKGQPIPTNDMWIAATAIQHDLAIFSYDNHFQFVDGLLVGKRLADFTVWWTAIETWLFRSPTSSRSWGSCVHA